MIMLPKCLGARVSAVLTMLAILLQTNPALAAENTDALRVSIAVERARPIAPKFDRKAFLSSNTLLGVALSPNGRNVAYLRKQGPNRSVWVMNAATGSAKRVLANTDASQVSWSRDGRWLFLETPAQVFALAVAGQTGSRAIAPLGGRNQREFLAVDDGFPAAVIVLERPPIIARSKKYWRLYRVDIHGKESLLHEDTKEIVDFAFDPTGRLAFLLRAEGDSHVIHRVDAAGKLLQIKRCVEMERCLLLATANQGRDVLMRTNVGSDLSGLSSLSSNGTLQTLHVDPRGEADVQDIVLDPVTREPMVIGYASTTAASYGLTAVARQHVDVINKHFPQRNLRMEVGHGADAYWLVHERSGSLRGERLHLYSTKTGSLREILGDIAFESRGKAIPRLPETAMARKIAFTYSASDGMKLHGFLMVPPGIDPSKAPMVASVHGGPFNHVKPEFSNDGQFLANRGYVVFQPNFRGSTGHGRQYMFAARGDFGNGRVQQDIVEGVRFLLKQGIGDPARVGIMGSSFGGYSTLLGVTFQSDLFKVGVASVPPADFGWTLREYLGAGQEMLPGIPMATSMRQLALDPSDKVIARRLAEQSPIVNAGKLNRPLLILAGGEDERVPIRGVTHYAAKLKSLGKDVSLFVDAEAGHSPDDIRTREAYYYLTELLMSRHLGGAVPSSPDKELGKHLERNLRIVGRDLQ